MKAIQSILSTLVLSAALVAPAAAGTGESTSKTASDLMEALQNDDYEVRDEYSRGDLEEGDSVSEWVTLSSREEHIIAVEGARGATDVDVRVYDENGNLVGSDTDGTNVALVRVSPRWTGRFRVVVTMAETCRGEGSFVTQFGSR